jgi:hypothetical protein
LVGGITSVGVKAAGHVCLKSNLRVSIAGHCCAVFSVDGVSYGHIGVIVQVVALSMLSSTERGGD